MQPGNNVMILLAPSKTMDFATPSLFDIKPQEPLFSAKSAQIAERLQKLTVNKIITSMSVSKPIAEAVHGSYANWRPSSTGKVALWTYTGDVYKGLQAKTMSKANADWAEQHLLIASGLYGLVRPYDGIQSYRLEMKSALRIGQKQNLYEFWEDKLSSYVNNSSASWVCNCSSDEYSRATVTGLKIPVVTPVFFDKKPNGLVGTVPIYSKMMRGVIARWMIDNRINKAEQLKDFKGHGYSYDAARSKPGFPAFSRAKMVPLQFN